MRLQKDQNTLVNSNKRCFLFFFEFFKFSTYFSLLHTGENTMNLKLLNTVNIIHFKTLLQNVINKMKIRTERRNVINIIENFFKDQSLIEIELNHLKFVKQKSKKLV